MQPNFDNFRLFSLALSLVSMHAHIWTFMLQGIGNQSKSMVCVSAVLFCFYLVVCLSLSLSVHVWVCVHASFNCHDSIPKVRSLNRSKLMAHRFWDDINKFDYTYTHSHTHHTVTRIARYTLRQWFAPFLLDRFGFECEVKVFICNTNTVYNIQKFEVNLFIFWAFYLSLICLLIFINNKYRLQLNT